MGGGKCVVCTKQMNQQIKSYGGKIFLCYKVTYSHVMQEGGGGGIKKDEGKETHLPRVQLCRY